MVMVSLDHRSELLAQITKTRKFGVNVLASGQAELAMRFASKGADTFEGFRWYAESNCPRFEGAAVWLACGLVDLVKGGDHQVALGEVFDVDFTDTEPLTYHAREFGTHAPVQLVPR
jgi:flavin reductase (DIM6/NTAB) family NADH-FMN oxidoreductase RutF